MIDEDAEEKISGDSGELAAHNIDLLLAFLGADDEPLPSSVLALVLALAFQSRRYFHPERLSRPCCCSQGTHARLSYIVRMRARLGCTEQNISLSRGFLGAKYVRGGRQSRVSPYVVQQLAHDLVIAMLSYLVY
jgi:hypothetical protein